MIKKIAKKNNNLNKTIIMALVTAFVLVVIDQILKIWALANVKPVGSMVAIPGLLNFTYVENRGAAFGIFQGQTSLLSIVSLLFAVVILGSILLKKIEDPLLIWSLSIVLAGGVGNVVDRIMRKYVVDYFDLTIGLFKNFPVFNFADCCVTIGAAFLLISILKYDDKKDNIKKSTENEISKDV